MAKSSTSFKKGDVGNPKGNPPGEPEAYRAKERLLQAMMASTTHDELVAAARRILETDDAGSEKYLKVYIAASSGIRVYTPEEKEESKARIAKLHAETAVSKLALEASNGKTIDQAGPVLLEAIKSAELAMDQAVPEKAVDQATADKEAD